MDLVSISKACKERNYSVKLVLRFLADNNIIEKLNAGKNRAFTNEHFRVVTSGKALKVYKQEFFDYIDSVVDNDDDLRWTDENMEMLDYIINPETRFKRIYENIQNKTLMVVDAEFKNGDYHEIAYELVKNGEVLESNYYLEKKHYLRRFNIDKRYHRLKMERQSFKVQNRKNINFHLKEALKKADYIIAHNAYGERNILIKNLKFIEKTKFLCTSKLSSDFVCRQSPSLTDLVEYYKLPHNSALSHYAIEDTRMARKVFYAMIEDAKNRYNF